MSGNVVDLTEDDDTGPSTSAVSRNQPEEFYKQRSIVPLLKRAETTRELLCEHLWVCLPPDDRMELMKLLPAADQSSDGKFNSESMSFKNAHIFNEFDSFRSRVLNKELSPSGFPKPPRRRAEKNMTSVSHTRGATTTRSGRSTTAPTTYNDLVDAGTDVDGTESDDDSSRDAPPSSYHCDPDFDSPVVPVKRGRGRPKKIRD